MLCCRLLNFFQNYLFQKHISGHYPSIKQFVIQIMYGVLLVLICVQNVCKGYQHTKNVTVNKERVKRLLNPKSATYNLQQTTISKFGAFSKITNKI